MPKFINKRPVIVEATQWFQYGDHPRVNRYIGAAHAKFLRCDCGKVMDDHGHVHTLGGRHTVCPGTWIINEANGEFSLLNRELFAAMYMKIDEPLVLSPAEEFPEETPPSPDDSTILCEPNFEHLEQIPDQEEDHDVSQAKDR